jgi:hypothetical protein
MKASSLMLGCIYALTMASCLSNTEQERWADDRRGQALSGALPLSAAERSAYVSDLRYIHGFVKPGTRVRLNFADPRQYNFIVTRLKLAGKTAANSPYLFERMEARRQEQLARGLRNAAVAEPIAAQNATGPIEQHFVETASLGAIEPASGAAVASAPSAVGRAASTRPQGSAYTYLDISISSVSGVPISPLSYIEQFKDSPIKPGVNVVTDPTEGDLRQTSLKRYTFSTYKAEAGDPCRALVDCSTSSLT